MLRNAFQMKFIEYIHLFILSVKFNSTMGSNIIYLLSYVKFLLLKFMLMLSEFQSRIQKISALQPKILLNNHFRPYQHFSSVSISFWSFLLLFSQCFEVEFIFCFLKMRTAFFRILIKIILFKISTKLKKKQIINESNNKTGSRAIFFSKRCLYFNIKLI